jgi:hypothetical protein
MEQIIANITTSIDSLALHTAQKLDNMVMFVNEYNATGMALGATKVKMQNISATVGAEISALSSTEIGYTRG